jgi:hypothetical protein
LLHRLLRFLLVPLVASGVPAFAQTIVTSTGPDTVDVTIYRDPRRAPGESFDLDWLNGYALISETRTISVPAGESEIRFEGVAAGIVPQSLVVTGFPQQILERNRDAYLLSPATLLDRSLGRRVTIQRTSMATGQVREMDAVIRTGADGAVVLQTPEGFEALRCTGLRETLIYDSVPAELSATPTLSLRVRAAEPITATVALAYLATGFDWQANYIATLRNDDSRIDLFAWLTLASNDETSFRDADTQAVAGRLNRENVRAQPPEGGPLALRCWPQATTSAIPLEELRRGRLGALRRDGENIIVTGSRIPRANESATSPATIVTAEQEELGDLKLYRIPEPVTVAANAQKQVALLRRQDVRASLVYRQRLAPGQVVGAQPAQRVLVSRNRNAEGLGLPLPGGRLVLFGSIDGRPIVLGEGSVRDMAVGEDVEIELGEAAGIHTETRMVRESRGWREFELSVTNDRQTSVRFEAEFTAQELRRRHGGRLQRRDGRPLWIATVPANGTATLRYRLARQDD